MGNLKAAMALVLGLAIGLAVARSGPVVGDEPASAPNPQEEPSSYYLPAQIELKPAANEAPVYDYN